jgi:hypothetical protein
MAADRGENGIAKLWEKLEDEKNVLWRRLAIEDQELPKEHRRPLMLA